jgi:hypothetical protein
MGLKHGHIVREDTPAGDNRIRRFLLDTGPHVYLPLALADRLFTYQASRHFYFVERGLLGRAEWVGTIDDLRTALARGELSQKDLGGFRLPPELPRVAGWRFLACNDDHTEAGARLEELRAVGERHGKTGATTGLSLNDRLAEMRADGCCLVDRADSQHGRVWCADKAGHSGNHAPVCIPCLMVLTIVDWSVRSSGNWGYSDERRAESRETFGPNGVQVAGLLDMLQRWDAESWKAVFGAHVRAQGDSQADRTAHTARLGFLIERAGRSAMSSGAINQAHVTQAKQHAEEVAHKGSALVIADPALRATQPPAQYGAFVADMLRSFANTTATLLVLRPFFEVGELEELWAPYDGALPLATLPDI